MAVNDNHKYTGIGGKLGNKAKIDYLHRDYSKTYGSAAQMLALNRSKNINLSKAAAYHNQAQITAAKLKAKDIVNGKSSSSPAATRTIVNTGAGYYGNANSAYTSANNSPSALGFNTASQLSGSNISGTLWEQLAEKNNEINMQMNRENNQFNAEQAQIQRNWEAQMSNTAHQREVADLKLAGLNPVLSAGGTGANTPSGSSANASNWTGADTSFINALASLAATAMSSNASITAASLNSAAVERAAAMNSNATMYASDNSARAAQYSADAAAGASRYGSDRSASASRYSANTYASSYKYGANVNAAASLINGALNLGGTLIPFFL